MRALKKNMVPFWYSLYEDSFPVTDEDGLLMGENAVRYSAPVQAYANISPSSSGTMVQPFGTDIRYDKVIVVSDPKFPVDEHSLLRLDGNPVYDLDGNLIPDYIVVRVSKSLNSVSYAVRKVEVR